MSNQNTNFNVSAFWKDINFLIWVLPIAGYLTAISFDIGYLAYFDIPLSFAELNFYSVALSAFVLYLMLLAGGFSLLSVAEFEEGKHWIFPTIFNTQLALGTIILAIFFYFDESLQPINALWGYAIFNIARIYVIYTDKDSNLLFAQRVRNFSFSNPSITKSSTQSVLKKKTTTLIDFLIILLGIFILAFMSGNSIAKIKSWQIEGHKNTIIVSRNNNLFIEKKYDPVSKVLKRGCKLIFATEDKISIVPLEANFRLKTFRDVSH